MRSFLLAVAANAALAWTVQAAEPLDLTEAVAIALAAGDPSVAAHDERALGLAEQAVADGQLPDPKVRLGLANMPLDSLDFSQEAMTQAQVGVSQAFPRGDTRAILQARRHDEAARERALYSLREAEIARDTRLAWLDVHYWFAARDYIAGSRQAVADLAAVATAAYAAGRQRAQDVLRAELEVSLIDDRLLDAERQESLARANLARLVGSAAERPLARDLPPLPLPPEREVLREALVHHPTVRVDDARVATRDRDIALAQQRYKPGWSLDAGYGFRAGGRADFASVAISLDVPLFTAKRQDRSLAAAKRTRAAALLDREATTRDLSRALDRAYADWEQLGARVALYEEAVTQRAGWTAEAALNAYRSGTADFAELVRARLAELDTALTLERLRTDRLMARAQLMYLEGSTDE